MATLTSLAAAQVLSEPTCVTEGAVVSTAHRMRYEMQEGCPPALFVYSYVAIAMIGFGWVASVLMYPIIYNGLFSIGVMLSNPLGERPHAAGPDCPKSLPVRASEARRHASCDMLHAQARTLSTSRAPSTSTS